MSIWKKIRDRIAPPKPYTPPSSGSGKLIVTPKESKTIPPSIKDNVKVVDNSSGSSDKIVSRGSSGGGGGSSNARSGSTGAVGVGSELGLSAPVDVSTLKEVKLIDVKKKIPSVGTLIVTENEAREIPSLSTTPITIIDPKTGKKEVSNSGIAGLIYTNTFREQENKIKALDYDDKGNAISFQYGNEVYSGNDAIDKLNERLNEVTGKIAKVKVAEREIDRVGLKQFSLDKSYQEASEKLETNRQKVFSIIDTIMKSDLPSKESIENFKKLNMTEEELNKIKGLTLTKKKSEFWENIQKELDSTKRNVKAEFTKGLVDDIFDILNISSLVAYTSLSDNKTKKDIGTMVLTSLAMAPVTYLNYLKKDPIKGIAFTAGSIYGIDGILEGISSTGKTLSKTVVQSRINKAINEIELIKKANLKKLSNAGFNVNKLTNDFGLDFARVVSGLADPSEIGLKIDLKKAPKKYIDAWNMFEGAGEIDGKISKRVLKEFSDKKLKKIDIKLKAKSEIKTETGIIRKFGKKIEDLADGKIVSRKTKGVTVQINEVPTGRIIGEKTGKNYIDNFIINKDKSFSGTAKRMMRDGDIVEQKYYTTGLNNIVREFYVNGKLKYKVTQSRTGSRIVVKSGKDTVLQSFNKPKLTKNLELLEDTWKEIKKKATIYDIQNNFSGRISSITKQFDYIKASPLKKSYRMEIKLKDGNKFKKIDVLTPAKIVKDQSQVFADFMKKRKTVLLADGYVNEITKFKSVVVPEYYALRKTLNSSQLTGIFKRNPTLLDKTRRFINGLNSSADRILNLKMNKRGSVSLGKGKYANDFKYANEVKVKYAKPLQVNLDKSISDMSRVLNAFQSNKNVAFNLRSSWASRLIRLKLQSEYLKYLNKQKIINLKEYAKLSNFDSIQKQKTAQDTKTQLDKKFKTKTKTKTENKMKLDRKIESKIKTDFVKMEKLKLDRLKFPKFREDSKQKFLDKVLGKNKAKSYTVLIGSGKKQRVASKRLKPEEAISYGAYLTDRKGDRTVRIIPAKGKPNQRFKKDYLAQASKKFRNYRIKKGKRVKYSSARLIEKRKYFNDLEKMSKGKKKVKLRKK